MVKGEYYESYHHNALWYRWLCVCCTGEVNSCKILRNVILRSVFFVYLRRLNLGKHEKNLYHIPVAGFAVPDGLQ